ncbi:glycosyltransferase [Rhodobacterales bacterium LSUCC0031]|nr:glycosyltransferase [Rhodobacterales bacterium LSUCC0031]
MSLDALDERVVVRRVEPNLSARFSAERQMVQETMPGDRILCFGNLPPLFPLAAHVTLFVQNRLLIEDSDLSGYSLLVRLRLALERKWLARCLAHCDEVVVQTATMARIFTQRFPDAPAPRILAFMHGADVPKHLIEGADIPSTPVVDFLYVANGEPHKNHLVLLEAWCLLADCGIHPSLMLTIDTRKYTSLALSINQAVATHDLKIVNIGAVAHEDAIALYRQACALLYPSTLEAFGIPLLEARQAGVDVLAPERDYVRDILDPVESFDPGSAVSIARAVRRYLGQSEPRYPAVPAADFLNELLAQS